MIIVLIAFVIIIPVAIITTMYVINRKYIDKDDDTEFFI